MLAIFKSGYSRIPVYDRDRNDIIGLILAKDLIFVDVRVSIAQLLHNCGVLVLLCYYIVLVQSVPHGVLCNILSQIVIELFLISSSS